MATFTVTPKSNAPGAPFAELVGPLTEQLRRDERMQGNGLTTQPMQPLRKGGIGALPSMIQQTLGLPLDIGSHSRELTAVSGMLDPFMNVGYTPIPSTKLGSSMRPAGTWNDGGVAAEDVFNGNSKRQVAIRVMENGEGKVDHGYTMNSIGPMLPCFELPKETPGQGTIALFGVNLAGLSKMNMWMHPDFNIRGDPRRAPNIVRGWLSPHITQVHPDRYPSHKVYAKFLLDFWRLCGKLDSVRAPGDTNVILVRAWANMIRAGVTHDQPNIWGATECGQHLWIVFRKRTLGYESLEDNCDKNGSWSGVFDAIKNERVRRKIEGQPFESLEDKEYWRAEPVYTDSKEPPPSATYTIPSWMEDAKDGSSGRVWVGCAVHYGIVQKCTGTTYDARRVHDVLIKNAIYHRHSSTTPMTDQDRLNNLIRAPKISIHLGPS